MKKANLLIVDDEVMILSNLEYILKNYAAKIFTATNGLEGLEIIAREEIHCVISDIKMPKMNCGISERSQKHR